MSLFCSFLRIRKKIIRGILAPLSGVLILILSFSPGFAKNSFDDVVIRAAKDLAGSFPTLGHVEDCRVWKFDDYTSSGIETDYLRNLFISTLHGEYRSFGRMHVRADAAFFNSLHATRMAQGEADFRAKFPTSIQIVDALIFGYFVKLDGRTEFVLKVLDMRTIRLRWARVYPLEAGLPDPIGDAFSRLLVEKAISDQLRKLRDNRVFGMWFDDSEDANRRRYQTDRFQIALLNLGLHVVDGASYFNSLVRTAGPYVRKRDLDQFVATHEISVVLYAKGLLNYEKDWLDYRRRSLYIGLLDHERNILKFCREVFMDESVKASPVNKLADKIVQRLQNTIDKRGFRKFGVISETGSHEPSVAYRFDSLREKIDARMSVLYPDMVILAPIYPSIGHGREGRRNVFRLLGPRDRRASALRIDLKARIKLPREVKEIDLDEPDAIKILLRKIGFDFGRRQDFRYIMEADAKICYGGGRIVEVLNNRPYKVEADLTGVADFPQIVKAELFRKWDRVLLEIGGYNKGRDYEKARAESEEIRSSLSIHEKMLREDLDRFNRRMRKFNKLEVDMKFGLLQTKIRKYIARGDLETAMWENRSYKEKARGYYQKALELAEELPPFLYERDRFIKVIKGRQKSLETL